MCQTLQTSDVPGLTAVVHAQGNLLWMDTGHGRIKKARKPAKRGKITSFSKPSRRRLMRLLARLLNRGIRATFITLTFTGEPSNEDAKRAFKQFAMRVRRTYPAASAVWRMDYQQRGAIHFHLLCFNLPFWKQADLQATWEDCTGEKRSLVDIRLVRGTRSVMAYISKYIAKVTAEPPTTSLDDGSYQHGARDDTAGRMWGWINKNSLPFARLVEGVLTKTGTIRNLSRYAYAQIGSDNPYNNLSFHLFSDYAYALIKRAIERGGMVLDDWYSTPNGRGSTQVPSFA